LQIIKKLKETLYFFTNILYNNVEGYIFTPKAKEVIMGIRLLSVAERLSALKDGLIDFFVNFPIPPKCNFCAKKAAFFVDHYLPIAKYAINPRQSDFGIGHFLQISSIFFYL
jgi:hypothetical protein